MGRLAPVVMSAATFAGSAQFAAASVLGAGGGVAAAVVAAILLNTRYAPIGVSVARDLRGGPLQRLLTAQVIVDESWAIGHLGGGRYDVDRMVGAGLVLWTAWLAGTVAGVLGGSFIGDPDRLGLDAAFPALFLALLAPQLRSRRPMAAAVAGGTIAALLIPFTRPGVPIVAAAAGCLVALVAAR